MFAAWTCFFSIPCLQFHAIKYPFEMSICQFINKIQSALRHLLPEKSDLFQISCWDSLLKVETKLSLSTTMELVHLVANNLEFDEIYFTLFA